MTSTDDRIATEDGLSERVAHLQNAMHRLGADVIRLQTQLSDLASAAPQEADSPAAEAPPFIFNLSRDAYKNELSSLVTWVNEFLVPVYVGEGIPWCPVWWEHHEAVGRLHALRLAYRELTDTEVSGATGPGIWHRDHLGPALDRLCAETGPFASCLTGKGHVERRRSQAAAQSA
ncbi:hypothetical protein F4561_000223 [Lipingzhangella halophila]|uniref:DUF4913 domain-containing protein n=1 Tax=Lipingzhangella halophila TaxID=1783352 RepID=A0A7W7RCD9_9ACTN|nr:DUF4913 domain-containing protein [Lipingzhangella halophila]MBB4929403.1 hypothetical protein [Lipingzhangella halophila]